MSDQFETRIRSFVVELLDDPPAPPPFPQPGVVVIDGRERNGNTMTDTKARPTSTTATPTRRRGLGIAVGAFAAIILISVGAITIFGGGDPTDADPVTEAPTTVAPEPAAQDPLAVAQAYWEAIIARDVDAAVATVDPTAFEWDVTGFRRSPSIANEIQFYEAIGLSWQLGDCELAGDSDVSCELTGRNDWSDALGMDPVPTVATVTVGENGITFVDIDDFFESQWGEAFTAFAEWVDENHLDDARVMGGVRIYDDEIIELFRVNTERFVAAQG